MLAIRDIYCSSLNWLHEDYERIRKKEQVFIQAKIYYMEYNYICREANMYDAQMETRLQEYGK
jgi:hypothetical protein